MIYKPPWLGARTPWQQLRLSQPGMHIPRHQHLPLGDPTVKNGCLWFLPAIHKLHVFPRHTVDHGPRILDPKTHSF
ncbi:MAG: hypothetical protein QGF00_15485 [Planctomycetota bacterium]|nr:hypothetical protein [Planctomycetota bacterium]MDP7251006.1 hypothetical protein [Planctomycetota bacterium]